MKRFAVFCFYDYYPGGGWNDFKGSFDTLEEGKQFAVDHKADNYQVIDLTTGEEVA